MLFGFLGKSLFFSKTLGLGGFYGLSFLFSVTLGFCCLLG
jgi:hypothetical protein